MRFALLNDKRIEATKGAKGLCPCCGSELVAKCGEIKVHHWSHKKKCDDHWWENETEWHRNWKNQFPHEWQEIIQKDESGEKHIADVKTSSGWTIEFQHSPISKVERDSRDYFYNKLIWVVDGTRRPTDIEQFESLIEHARTISNEPFMLRVLSDWTLERCRLNQEWGSSMSLVLFDFGKSKVNYRDKYSSNKDLWLIYPSKDRTHISCFSKDTFIEMMNSSRSDEVYKMLLNPIQTKLTEEIEQEQKRIDTLAIPIYQKVGYIIGILRNRAEEEWFDEFDEFDIKIASKILNKYVEAYIRRGYSDMEIEFRLDGVKSHAIGSHKWTAWVDSYERFTQEVIEGK
jgi:competence protein CoiA